jgi:hypothetical protein
MTSYNWAFDEFGSNDTMYEGLGKIQLNGLTHIGGTAAGTNNEGYLWHDITIPYNFATDLLDRFSNGAPKIKFTTGLDNIHLELGDLVSIDNDWFLYSELSLNGLDSTVKFEVTKKEVSLTGSAIGVDYEAVYITKDSPPSIDIDWIPTLDVVLSPINKGGLIAQFTEMPNANALESGCSVTATTGLGYQIDPGRMLAAGTGALLQDATTFTATANKHSYIGIDSASGNILVNEVATSADEPELAPGEIRIGKVISGASSVSSVVDLRQFGAITARQLNRELLAPSGGALWNGGFEDWPDAGSVPTGWTETGDGVAVTDWAREASVVHTGRYALKMLNTSDSVVWYSGFMPIDNSTPYRVSLWARQTGNVTMRADLYWYTSAKVAASTSSVSITNAACAANNTWENRTAVVTPGSDVAYAKIKITRNTSPGYDCYYDDVTIKPEAPSFNVYGAATVAPGTKSAFQVKYNNEGHDYGGNYDHSGSDYDFEAPSAGTYEFSAAVQGVYVGAFTYLTLMVYKNGSVLRESYGGARTTGTLEAFATVETGPVELAKGDLITVYMHPEIQTSYTLNTGASETYFSGRKIT